MIGFMASDCSCGKNIRWSGIYDIDIKLHFGDIEEIYYICNLKAY